MKQSWPIACFDLPYRFFPLGRALAGIRSAGYSHFGLLDGMHAEVPVIDGTTSDADADAFGRLVADHGLTPTVFAPRDVFAGLANQLHPKFERLVELAARLGYPFLLAAGTWGYKKFPDVAHSPETLAAADATFSRNVQAVLPALARFGRVLLVKPHTGNTATGADCRRLVQRFGSEHFRVAYDPANVRYYEGVDPVADVGATAQFVRAVTVKDQRGGRATADFPPVGQGEIDFAGLFARLASAHFAGPIIVERVDGSTGAKAMTAEQIDLAIRQAREHLSKILGQSK